MKDVSKAKGKRIKDKGLWRFKVQWPALSEVEGFKVQG
jgi:hypothetical protein